jgi:hypothetical protein
MASSSVPHDGEAVNPEVPQRIGRILDGVMARDRLYFRRNPEEPVYSRAYVPGEFHPYRFDRNATVRVTAFTDPTDGVSLLRIRRIADLMVVDDEGHIPPEIRERFLPPTGMVLARPNGSSTHYYYWVSMNEAGR